mmetsp:Transcript_49676/g.106144  ORF Transcript_49676/g.106144 Transcript_49676/m.106144 type:complete len:99 (-) Transcript_49676:218-514(-)
MAYTLYMYLQANAWDLEASMPDMGIGMLVKSRSETLSCSQPSMPSPMISESSLSRLAGAATQQTSPLPFQDVPDSPTPDFSQLREEPSAVSPSSISNV